MRPLSPGARTALAAVVIGCGSGSNPAPPAAPPDHFAYAYASPDCAPWDGRAVQIVLTTTPTATPEAARPQLRLAIYPRADAIAGTTYRWPAEPEAATGGRCLAEDCQTAPAGEIRLGPARADSALEGTVTLRFGPGDVVTGGFRAAWQPRRILCG